MPQQLNGVTGEDTRDPSADEPTSSSCPASSFHAFTKLPRAVASRIITLACRSPESSCSAAEASQRSPLALDVTTTLSLARVCRSIHIPTTFLLYESVRVVKPSALLELHSTISAKPARARLIKNLHIGGEETFATSEWPLSLEPGSEVLERPLLRLKTTLAGKDTEKLPAWCTPERTWPLDMDRVDRSDAREVAVVKAIISALDYIDLDPYARDYGKSGTEIGIEMWAVRIFELQACLDLYLAEMRRIDENRKPPAGTAAAESMTSSSSTPKSSDTTALYPRLVVSYMSSKPSRGAARKDKAGSGGKAFVVTRQQLWQYLTRRGTNLDHYDHPVIYARLGLIPSGLNGAGCGRMCDYLEGPHRDHFKQPPAKAIPVEGKEDPGKQLGPLLSTWSKSTIFAKRPNNYSNLESLRVCGQPLTYDECKDIAGATDRFPQLKRLQYEMVMSHQPCQRPEGLTEDGKVPPRDQETEFLLQTINALHGDAVSPEPQMTPRLMEVRVHHKTWPDLARSQSPETITSWRTGTLRVDEATGNVSPHRLWMRGSVAADTEDQPAKGVKMLHEEAREWWEECAALEKERRDPGVSWMPNAKGGYELQPPSQREEGGEDEAETVDGAEGRERKEVSAAEAP